VEATDATGNVVVETRPLLLLANACAIMTSAATLAQGQPLSVQGVCSSTAAVERVDFFVDGLAQRHDTTSPYNWVMDTSAFAVGTRAVRIKAVLAGGAEVNETVNVEITAPALSVTFSPGPVVSRGESLTVAAAPTDGRPMRQVDFFFNGQFRGGDSAAPHQYVWQGSDPWTRPDPFGRHTIVIQGTDTNGNVLSATRDIYLLTQTCNVLLGSSRYRGAHHDQVHAAPHAFRQGEGLTAEGLCSATAAVLSVEFYLDGVLQGTEATAPYTWPFASTGLALGSHTVSIIARLAGGATSTHSMTFEIVAP
jgi:hypothetical protein